MFGFHQSFDLRETISPTVSWLSADYGVAVVRSSSNVLDTKNTPSNDNYCVNFVSSVGKEAGREEIGSLHEAIPFFISFGPCVDISLCSVCVCVCVRSIRLESIYR